MLSSYVKPYVTSRFVRNVAAVAAGTAAAQAIAIAFSPLVTRLYGPEAFGVLGVFLSVVTMITPVAALTYPIAIVLPKSDSDARGLVRLSLSIALVVFGVITLALVGLHQPIVDLLQIHAIAPFLFLIPPVIFLGACQQIAQQWLIRKKKFTITAKITAFQALIVNSSKVGIGFFHPVAAALVSITALGQVLHVALLTWGAKRSEAHAGPNAFGGEEHRPSSLGELARRHNDFPLYRAPQVLINAVSTSMPVLLLAAFFGPAAAGFYAICSRVLSIPSQLIGQAVSDVFYPHITEAHHRGGELTPLILKATLGLALIGIVPFALVVAFGPWLFGFVFGAQWTVAGEYARWLSFMLFFNFINRPAVASIPVLNLQRGLMLYELFSTGTKLVALYFGFFFFKDDIIAIALFSVSGAVAYIFLIYWIILESYKRSKAL